MRYGFYYNTIIGKLGIVSLNQKIVQISFIIDFDELKETEEIKKCHQQLDEYFLGKRKQFTIDYSYNGTDFQKKVYQALEEIPYGKTVSYQDIAVRINNPKAVRAVGNANNKNRIMIVVPCHRVIGKNGKLVGFGAGIIVKEKLLEIEKINR